MDAVKSPDTWAQVMAHYKSAGVGVGLWFSGGLWNWIGDNHHQLSILIMLFGLWLNYRAFRRGKK